MFNSFYVGLNASLQRGDIAGALTRVRLLLNTPDLPSLTELIENAPVELKSKLVLLLRDVLSRYPTELVGIPFLVCAQDIYSSSAQPQATFKLPLPTGDLLYPCADAHFVGWIPSATGLPLKEPLIQRDYDLSVSLRTSHGFVALFRLHSEVYDLETVTIPPFWWGHVFEPIDAKLTINFGPLMAYPDALEALSVMLHYCGQGPKPPLHFLSAAEASQAAITGLKFFESCAST